MPRRFKSSLFLSTILAMLVALLGVPASSRQAYGEEGQPVVAPSQVSRSPVDSPYEIQLRSRQFTPEAGIEPALLQHSIGASGLNADSIHVLVQLYDAPDREVYESLESAHIELLNYIPRNAWFASMPAGLDPAEALESLRVAEIVRWAGTIWPEDKVSRDVWSAQIGGWAIAEDGRVRLAASFFDDVSLESAHQVVSRHGGVIEGEVPLSNKLLILVQASEIPALAAEDTLRWLDQVPPPPIADNDGSRVAANVNAIQAAPYDLSGTDVDLGIWDEGLVDRDHEDFRDNGTYRVTQVETAGVLDHATHVAGTMAGNGARSESAGGTARQWRGMAPEADIISYDFNTPVNDYGQAINTYGIDVSNNSWGRCVAGSQFPTNVCGYVWPFENCDDYGDYRYDAPDFDRIVRGEHGRRIPIIFSAGNERNDGDCGMAGAPNFVNYGNITPPATAKNTITVGALNSDDSTMTTFSSWGPVDDGRLKPEVLAAGCERETIRNDTVYTRTIWSTLPGNTYGGECGTSMAAPAVSGISALLIEQYRETHGGADPWPSTIKALLVHSAHDLSDGTSWYNPGPDYASGYGLVDAQGAADLIRGLDLRQDTISADDEDDYFYIWVPSGAGSLKVTLDWDDPPAAENAATALVNDLDLQLWGPTTCHYPWVLDPDNPANAAFRGRDDTNNLEQVFVENPTPGEWTIVVSGFHVPQAPQDYSLVSEALFEILSPTGAEPAYAGPHNSPHKLIVRTTKPANGLTKNDFDVTIGGTTAGIITSYEGSEEYVLEVSPLVQVANGLYDLVVSYLSGSDTEPNAVKYADSANVDVVLVIDRSGSMSGDKMNAAKEAAKQLVDFMHVGDMIGVVSFSTAVSTNFPLTRYESEDTKTQAKSAIDALSASGNTSIGGGLQRGQEQLSTLGDASHPWALVLLSDGQENTAPYVADVLPSIVASKTVAHTIGLGSGADEALMLDIATQTGGTYHFAPTPEELGNIYNTIVGAVTDQQALFAEDGIAEQGVTDEKDVVVDSTVSEATFSVNWINSSSNIDLTLRKPNGIIIDPAQAAANPDVDYVSGSTYEYYRVRTPTLTAGVWQMLVTGASIAASQELASLQSNGEPYVARVTAIAGLTMRFSLDGQNHLTTQAIKLIVTLSDDQPITGAAVHINVEPPSQAAALIRQSEWIEVNGDTVPDPALVAELEATVVRAEAILTLYDDGAHGDGAAGDGVYANSYTPYSVGSYTFTALASGTSNSGEGFVRTGDISTYVAKGPDLPPVYVPLVAKNFTYVPPVWTNIMTENLEGSFPSGGWSVFGGTLTEEIYWDDDDFKPYQGGRSAWPANGGPYGLDPQYFDYPNDLFSWMEYGPFSLSDALDAELQFYYWNQSELDYDYLFWGASVNGTDFYGTSVSGNSGGWQFVNFDLTNVYVLGDLAGEPEVWIGFAFWSDESITDQGAFVDNIVLRKLVMAAGAPVGFAEESVSSEPPSTLAVDTDVAVSVHDEVDRAAKSPTPSSAPTGTPTLTATPTVSEAATPAVSPSSVPTATVMPAPTPTTVITATATPTSTPTPTLIDALTPIPEAYPTPEGSQNVEPN